MEVRSGAQIRSASQTWALLARLEREGLLVNEANGSGKAWKNAWRLSERGENVLKGLPAGMYAEAAP
jgi:DNA-binding PadR family transcriptional regulator